jgi:hypothetical protein
MGVLQRFERRLEGMVTGAFTKAFRAEVQPVEIAAALQRELDNNAQIVTRERSLVPNDFVIELGSHDYGRLEPYSGTLAHELVELAKEHADLQHYAFTGPVTVAFEQLDDLGTGPDAQMVVVDLGSTNGTVVDGVRAAQAPLSDGSRIVLGSTIVDVHRRVARR